MLQAVTPDAIREAVIAVLGGERAPLPVDGMRFVSYIVYHGFKDLKLLQALINKGVQPTTETLGYAVHNGFMEVVKLLVDHKVPWICGMEIYSVLHNLARRPLDQCVEPLEFYLRNGGAIDATQYQQTMLHDACKSNTIDTARFLLEHGSNVNHQDEGGLTPLFFAQTQEMIALLLSFGANIQQLSLHGLTPLHFQCEEYLPCESHTEFALRYPFMTSLKDNYGQTPLDIAIKGKNDGVVRMLAAVETLKRQRAHTPGHSDQGQKRQRAPPGP
jgi:hypothetical protein